VNTDAVTPESLMNVPLFGNFTESELRQLIDIGQVKTFQPGEMIVEQDDTSQELWVLLEGKCEVLRQAKIGKGSRPPISLASLEPFANFGEMSFFHPAPHSASVRAQTSVKLLCIRRSALDELLYSPSSVALKLSMNIIASLAERIRRMDDWVVDLMGQNTLAQKIPELMRLREQMFESWML
jgi:CRP-like cAMP-binding protein